MKKILILVFIFILTSAQAQEIIIKPAFLQQPMDSITMANFNKQLDAFFLGIKQGKIDEDFLTPNRKELTQSQLRELVNYEVKKDSTTSKIKDKQLINIYPISIDSYFLTIAYLSENVKSNPVLIYSINLIATKTNNKFTFSVPIDFLTRYWKTETIGNITYHFRGKINKERAELFNKTNTIIAEKLNVKPEKFDFYMCDNFQEISTLLGFDYSIQSNGKYRDGYGVDTQTIFSVMNNEDFSHDIFHYYSGQINKRINRNWITEEGIAYAWGNAYYTDKEGEMITHNKLAVELKNYLSKNPEANLFSLFSDNTKIFDQIAPEISIRSTISGIIAVEVERKKGSKGILALINAGSRDRLTSYLKATDELLGINETNFNSKVEKLINDNY